MIKIKHLVVVAIATFFMYSCSDDRSSIEEFDHEAQALIDNGIIVGYLKGHYLDTSIDSIKPLVTGKTALFDDPKLFTKSVVENDVTYSLYYYVIEEGTPDPVKGFPTQMDSVLVKYQGRYLTNSVETLPFEDRAEATWLTLSNTITGWTQGFVHFKGGRNITGNGPITYENFGRGILLMPSGLAYKNFGSDGVPSNVSLQFYINLLDIVENTDHDNDGLASGLEIEDASTESNPRLVDTDGDGLPNYLDADDDGDGVPTRFEDKNKDGDPRNDFSDPNNPTLPDYLNPKIRVRH